MIDYKKITAKIQCGESSYGTAFLISNQLAITAAHVVDEGNDTNILLTFYIEENDIEVKGKALNLQESLDNNIDAVIIQLDKPVDFFDQEVLFIRPSRFPEKTPWKSYAYAVKKEYDEPLRGYINNSISHKRETKWDIDIHCENSLSDYKGASGSPLIINEKIAGIIIQQTNNTLVAVSTRKLKEFLEWHNISIIEEDIHIKSFNDQEFEISIQNNLHNQSAIDSLCISWLEQIASEIEDFLPISALKKIEKLENIIQNHGIKLNPNIQGNIKFCMAQCSEATGKMEDSYKLYLQAHRKFPDNLIYKERALMSYYYLKDNDYQKILEEIKQEDKYHPLYWGITTLNSGDILGYIQNVPKNVQENIRFKRVVFSNSNQSDTLLELLGLNQLSNMLTEKVTYSNIYQWLFIFDIKSFLFFRDFYISFNKNDSSTQNRDWIDLFNLIKPIHEASNSDEMGHLLNPIHFYYFWLEGELDLQETTIFKQKESFQKLKNPTPFQYFLLANSIQKYSQNYRQALLVLKQLEYFDEPLYQNIVLSLYLHIQLGSSHMSKWFKEYFQDIKKIGGVSLYMLSNICQNIHILLESKLIKIEECISTLEESSFEKPLYRDFCVLFAKLFNKNSEKPPKKEIEVLYEELKEEASLQTIFAQIYASYGYYHDSLTIMDSYVVLDKESYDLFHYLRLLNALNRPEDKEKLVELLEHWRKNYTFEAILLKIELEIKGQGLNDWDEVIAIASYGLEKKPDDEVFMLYYFTGLFYKENKYEIEKIIPKILEFEFYNVKNVIAIVDGLSKIGFTDDAIDLLYKYAEMEDIEAKNFYFQFMNTNQKEYPKYEKVEIGLFVLFSIEGISQPYHITENNMKKALVQQSLGKSLGEKLIIITDNTFAKIKKEVTISKIMNKYQHLLYQISLEIQHPLSEYPVHRIDMPNEENIVEEFHDILIKQFGLEESIRQEEMAKRLEDYLNYRISFTELANLNYRRSLYDTYLFLTNHKNFCITPLPHYKDISILETDDVVIDFASSLLFYYLQKNLGLTFKRFRISPNVFRLLNETISKIQENKASKFNLVFGKQKIMTYYYTDEFYDKKIEELQAIKKWFKENCEYGVIRERLTFVDKKDIDVASIQIMFDNTALLLRDNTILISDELAYGYLLNSKRILSSEKYLLEMFPERKQDILLFLLSNRYLGITLDYKTIYRAFVEQHLPEKEHLYKQAIENLLLESNFNSKALVTVVLFLKELALNSLMNNQYKREATFIFTELLKIPTLNVPYLIKLIQGKFFLMHEYLNKTFQALEDAQIVVLKNSETN